jgi:anhydro-N-acetylmuramic acid kinase
MSKERNFLGMVCGEAGDGVDIALVAITGKGLRIKPRILASTVQPLDDRLGQRLRGVLAGEPISPERLATLRADLALAASEAGKILLENATVKSAAVTAVGLCAPEVSSDAGAMVSLAEPALLAQTLEMSVVSNFASADLAAGGNGIAITAWPLWKLFSDTRLSRVVVHLGGLATVTFIPAAAVAEEVYSFGVAPAGWLIDALTRTHFQQPCDMDGAIASRGRVSPELLNELSAPAFFHSAPPKAVRLSDWNGLYVQRLAMMAEKYGLQPADLIATVTELVARRVSAEIGRLTERPHEVILAGGGAKNIHLAGRIRSLLSPSSTYPTERYGMDGRALRAACSAMLAAGRLDEARLHCPAAGGAEGAKILGEVLLF